MAPPRLDDKEKNSKVGNFPLRYSYVECVLMLKLCGWRNSFPTSSGGPFWGGMRGKKPCMLEHSNETLTNKGILFILFMPTLASEKGKNNCPFLDSLMRRWAGGSISCLKKYFLGESNSTVRLTSIYLEFLNIENFVSEPTGWLP